MRKQETIEQYRRIIGVLDDEITEIEKSAVEEIMSIMTRTVDKTGREFRVALWARFGDNNEIGVFSVE